MLRGCQDPNEARPRTQSRLCGSESVYRDGVQENDTVELMNENEDLFGTDPFKLHRRDSPDTSVEAAYSVDTTNLERLVFEYIKARGENGCIADDLLRTHTGYPYSSITARFAALERKGLIYYKGDKRKGRSGRNQRVMRPERRKEERKPATETFELTSE